MLKDLFLEQKNHLNNFFDTVDLDAAEELLQLFRECQGLLFFTGVGKSGLIAKKIAVTMTSVGVKALYLSPLDALHGDIGILSEEDIFVMISKSGESDELLHLVPYLRNKGAKLVCMTCVPGSRLAKGCDFEMVLPMEKELCPFGLMPTTSSAIQMIFGDILAAAMMISRNVQIEDYQMNHPAGTIGRRMTLKVSDLMLTGEDIPKTTPEKAVLDALVQLSDKRCGCLLIVDHEERLVGIFTDGDLRRALQKYGNEALSKTFDEVMTENPRSIPPDVLVTKAVEAMEADMRHPITVLPVVGEGKKVIGLIKMHDIIQSGV